MYELVFAFAHHGGMAGEVGQVVDRVAIHAELEAARAGFHDLLDHAAADRLRAPTQGTPVEQRGPVVPHAFRLHGGAGSAAAGPRLRAVATGRQSQVRRVLDAATGPFDLVNYNGSCFGTKLIGHDRMGGCGSSAARSPAVAGPFARVLRKAGLVDVRQDAQRRVYTLRPGPLAEVDAWLAQYRVLWEQRLDALHTEIARGTRQRRSSS